MHASNTPHSSMTMHEPHSEPTADTSPPRSPLDEEIFRDESRFERYGGDDVEDPPPKSPDLLPVQRPPTPKDALLVAWDGPDDPANPQNWSIRQKWKVTVLCALMTINVTFASSAPTAATRGIIAEFGVSREVNYLVTSVFLLGYVFGPLLWGPGSELVGRRPVFLFTLSTYTLFHFGQALARNIETLLVTRFFAGFFAVAPLTISGGTIADTWPPAGRGPAASLFGASVFFGPVLGPIVGGCIADSSLSWRWIFWVMMIFAGTCVSIAWVFLPETYAPVILAAKARRLRKSNTEKYKDIYAEHERQDYSLKGLVHRTVFRPFKMLAMEPILVLVTIYLSVVYGVLYALFEAFPIIFIETRGFTLTQNGLIFIGVGIGTNVGGFINARASAHYPALIRTWKGFPPPEQRLFGAMIGAPCLVVGSFWMGWTGEYAGIPWYVPAMSTVLIGMSISMIFMSFLAYLIDTYLMYSASALASNVIIRSLVGAAFPLFTVQMYTKLGINWASTLVGLIGLVLAPIPFLFFKFGPRIRAYSKFAPCIDLKIAKELEREREREGKEKEKDGQEPQARV